MAYSICKDTVRELASEGLYTAQIARELKVDRGVIKTVMKREGILCIDGRDYKGRTPRQAVQDMKPVDAVEYLLGVIELLSPVFVPDHPADKFNLTGLERRLLLALAARTGSVFTKESLHDACYSDSLDCDVPHIGIIDVYICKLRKKLLHTTMEIVNVRGYGYVLNDPEKLLKPKRKKSNVIPFHSERT